MRFDSAGWPFVGVAVVPTALSWALGPLWLTLSLAVLPIAVLLFFRDPDRHVPTAPGLVVAPADGRVLFAGPARPAESPPGDWLQVCIFLSALDVHINRSPVSGLVTRLEYLPGSFRAAFRHDAYRNERTEIWLDHGGTTVVVRQIVGLLARRIVCRLAVGETVARGGRIGLMKFGSRMDVFLPSTATLAVQLGDRTEAGVSILGYLETGAP